MAKAANFHTPTQEQLKRLLDYNPETGIFRWLVRRPPKNIGDVAGSLRDTGYITISIGKRFYRAHQLAWLWMTSEWPPRFIDHIDTNKSNNCWNNLRLATKSQNMANMPAPKHNTSGFKGASRYRAGESYGKGWQASISKDRKTMHLGHFATAEEAHAAYVSAAKRLFGEFARGS